MAGKIRKVIITLAVALMSSGATATLPADVSEHFGNISSYSTSSGILTIPCMAFFDSESVLQLDDEGQPMIFSATMGTLPGLQFYLLQSTRLDPAVVDSCSGSFSNGVYTDLVYLYDSGPQNSGKVLGVTMDLVLDEIQKLVLRHDFAVVHDPYDTAVELTHTFITLLQQDDSAGLEEFLSAAFILQRANGSYYLKDDYLQNLPEIGDFAITEVVAQQTGSTLIVRWQIAIQELIDGVPFSGTPAPRLSTFIYQDGSWRMTSHANFNTPAS